MNKQEVEQLGNKIKWLPKPEISANKKNLLKNQVLKNILVYNKHYAKDDGLTFFRKLIHRIKLLAKSVVLDNELKSDLKAKVLTLAEANPQYRKPFVLRVFTLKKATAYVMMGVLFMFSFMIYNIDRNVVLAKDSTLIEEVRGEVMVIRNGERVYAEPDMELQEGDLIKTSSNGFAVIRYFDDSITRLSSNTEIVLTKLFQDSLNKTKFEIEVELKNGRSWVRIMDMVNDESTFSISAESTKANVKQKAVLDVQVDDKKSTKVSVFEDTVSVEVNYKNKKSSKVVTPGYQLQTENEKKIATKAVVLPTIKNEPWIALNTQKDSLYLNQVKEDNELDVSSKAGLLPSDPFYPAKKLKEQTSLMVTLDDVAKAKLELDYAEKRALEAAIMYNDGDDELAETALKEFTETIESNVEIVEDSDVLKEYAEGKINSIEKELDLASEDSSYENLKNEVESASLILNNYEYKNSEVIEFEGLKNTESNDNQNPETEKAPQEVEFIKVELEAELPEQEDLAVIVEYSVEQE